MREGHREKFRIEYLTQSFLARASLSGEENARRRSEASTFQINEELSKAKQNLCLHLKTLLMDELEIAL